MAKLKNPKWERFCQLYTSKDMFGDGKSAWCEAYNKTPVTKAEWNIARNTSGRLLRHVAICGRINRLLEKIGLSKENARKQHLFLMNQHFNLELKMRAVEAFYNLDKKESPTVVNNLIITLEQYLLAKDGAVSNGRDRVPDPQLPEVQKCLPENTHEGVIVDPLHSESGAEVHGEEDQWSEEGW
jgi:hypothetical protein